MWRGREGKHTFDKSGDASREVGDDVEEDLKSIGAGVDPNIFVRAE